MQHANARLSPYARRLLVERVRAGHKPGEVAKQLGVSRRCVCKWLARFQAEGSPGVQDRSSRPHSSPTRTPVEVEDRIVAARRAEDVGAAELAVLLNLPASTIGAVLRRRSMPHLADIDRITGEVLRGHRSSDQRYAHARPGDLLHVDVKKLGRVPDGGGWRVHGRSEAVRGHGNGWDYCHVAIDDHSRLAYVEVLPDERGLTCAAFLHRAASWFHDEHGVTIRRVLTDNAKSYRVSRDWIASARHCRSSAGSSSPAAPGPTARRKGSTGRCRTRWAYRQPWLDNDARTAALPEFLTYYNTARGHTGLAGATPLGRLAA